MATDKKYLVLQNNYSIAYDESNCYVDGKIKTKDNNDTSTPSEQATALKKEFYNRFFKTYRKNIVILTAAGTSMDNGVNKGKTRVELWDECKIEINDLKEALESTDFGTKDFITNKNIEDLLSYVILYERIHGEIKDKSDKSIREKIQKKIIKACSLIIDEKAPHRSFLDKITARKNSDSRVQLFTTNYDTLFEDSATGYVIIDGFSFTHPRKFSGSYFDFDIVYRDKTRLKEEESFISKVFHLYKLHGSLNWEKKDNEIIQTSNTDDPLIIYPASDKYESSYEQPYFEMMSRFQQALRNDDTLLIVIGFGFQDKHIQNVIKEAVEQNSSFQLVIVNYDKKSGTIQSDILKEYFADLSAIKPKRKVTIIFDTFKDFTENYPENKTYTLPKEEKNEPIQS